MGLYVIVCHIYVIVESFQIWGCIYLLCCYPHNSGIDQTVVMKNEKVVDTYVEKLSCVLRWIHKEQPPNSASSLYKTLMKSLLES